jgi:TrmH family RNA methyltransferase
LGIQIFLADVDEGEAYTEVDLCQPLGLVIGGEAHGASAAARELAHRKVHIPMAGEVESLNAAVAAAVILFEARRQRRK